MALQGTIDSFPVVDVLGMLSSSSKTGCLELVGDRGRSRVWVHDGRIVGGEVEQHPTSDAADVVFEFLLNESGSFEFVTDASAPEENLDSGIEEAVAEAERMVQEWSEVREVVPDTSMVVTLVADPGVEGRRRSVVRRWIGVARREREGDREGDEGGTLRHHDPR